MITRPVMAKNLRRYQLVDLEGDAVADPTGCEEYAEEYQLVDEVQHGDAAVTVRFDESSHTFEPDHIIQVVIPWIAPPGIRC